MSSKQEKNSERKFRYVSLAGCKLLGKGAHGAVYRLNDDQIIKVYTDNSKLSEIDKERLCAQTAFFEGIPTCIAYDTVVTEEGIGVIFEMIKGSVLGSYMNEHQNEFDTLIDAYVGVLKLFHSTKADTSKYLSSKEVYIDIINRLPEKKFGKKHIQSLINVVNAAPDGDNYIHNDLHPQNIIRDDNGELMIIDMADVSYGHFIFDLGGLYTTLVFSASTSSKVCERVTGLTTKQAKHLWKETLKKYFNTNDEKFIRKIEKSCAILRDIYLLTLIVREGNVWSPLTLSVISIWVKFRLVFNEKACVRELSSFNDAIQQLNG